MPTRSRTTEFLQRPQVRLAILLVLLGLALALPNRYALTIFHEANTAGRVYAVQSLVHYGSWSFESILCRTGPHHGLIDLSVRDGRPLLQKAPGMSWLAVPGYAAATVLYGGKLPFHQAATLLGLLCSWLPGLVLLFLLGRWWMREFGANFGLLAVFGLLAASPFWTYLPMFMDYALASLLLPVAWAAWRSRKRWHWVVGGLLAGLAGTVNYMFIVYSALLFLLALAVRWKERSSPARFALSAAIGGLAPAIALLVYHAVVWGHPLATAYDFMAHDVHKAMHGATGFSLRTFADAFVHPKLGLVFTTPWVLVGWFGLVRGLREEEHRVEAVAGLAMTLATLLFVTFWRGSNSDDLAFNRHAMPLLPWAAMGVASALHSVRGASLLPRKMLNWGLAGTLLVAFLYQFVTAWTYPYHHDAVDSPLWQVNLPLFVNGFILPTVTLSPVMRSTLDVLGQGLWWRVAVSILLVVTACLAAGSGAGKRAVLRHYLALPATFVLVVTGLLLWGISSDTAGPGAQQTAARAATRIAAGEPVAESDLQALKAVSKATRYYEMASTDVHGSYFTPQDVLWDEDGYAKTNEWCR